MRSPLNVWSFGLILFLGLTASGSSADSGVTKAYRLITLPYSQVQIKIPAEANLERRRINWETDEFDITLHGQPLMRIVLGGGAYDVGGLRKICLNGKRAWDSGPSNGARTVLIGNPGIDTMELTYAGLSQSTQRLADAMISSVRYGEGGYPCKAS